MVKQFLDFHGLEVFFGQLLNLFASKAAVASIKEATDPYIFDIDYTVLEFDTNEIISNSYSSSEIGIGIVDYMIIASS